jgi:hypothetical protein
MKSPSLSGSPFLWLGMGIVAFQRFGVTIGDGSVPLSAFVLLWVALLLLAARQATLDPMRVALLLGIISVGSLGLIASPGGTSFSSLVLVVALWAPGVLSFARCFKGPKSEAMLTSGRSVANHHALLTGSFWMIVIAACFGVVQFALSYSLGILVDPLKWLPTWLELPGFNSTYPVVFGSTWYRANGGIFLEASFLSLFAVFALIVVWENAFSLTTRVRLFVTAILTIALLGSVATSGLVLAPFLVISLLRRHSGRVVLGILAACLVGASALPPISSFMNKAMQNPFDTSGQISVAARIYRPYVDMLELVLKSPLIGNGPGSSRAYVEGLDIGVTTPTIMKVMVEYGTLGFIFFALLWWSLYKASKLSWLIKVSLLVALIVPTDGLTNSLLVPLFTWLMLLSDRRTELNFDAKSMRPTSS